MILVSGAGAVIDWFGGIRPTARKVARDPSSVCKWETPEDQGGRGGRVPGSLHKKILTLCRNHPDGKPDITADVLINGRKIPRAKV